MWENRFVGCSVAHPFLGNTSAAVALMRSNIAGCGKSTLMLAIFRIMELEAGSIRIDDVDISKIGLQDLRRNLCLVPQDPVIFCGSVRMNLDPFDTVTDDSKIWEALRQAHLSDFVQTLEVCATPSPCKATRCCILTSHLSPTGRSGCTNCRGRRKPELGAKAAAVHGESIVAGIKDPHSG